MRKVIVNFSGGVDSIVAILEALKRYPKEEIVLCWQDTGAEYLETEAHIKTIAGILELPLEILRRKEQYWDLVKRFTRLHPDLYEQACLIEDDIKHKWKDGFGFNDLMKQGRLL